MRSRGMDIAVVETGGDPGHAPARAAYEKAGFRRTTETVEDGQAWVQMEITADST